MDQKIVNLATNFEVMRINLEALINANRNSVSEIKRSKFPYNSTST